MARTRPCGSDHIRDVTFIASEAMPEPASSIPASARAAAANASASALLRAPDTERAIPTVSSAILAAIDVSPRADNAFESNAYELA